MQQLAVVVVAVGLGLSSPAWAAETKIDCLTNRVYLRDGTPSVVLVSFDEYTARASLFIKEYGGILRGENVDISQDLILFSFKTTDGTPGEATISRADGTAMIKLKREPELRFLATCRAQPRSF